MKNLLMTHQLKKKTMKKTIKNLVVLFVLAVSLVSCSNEPLTSGTVTEKKFSPAHYEDYMQQIYTGQTCTRSGKTQICTPRYTYIWNTRLIPDDWDIKIKACGAEAKTDDGSCREEWIDVDETTYHKYEQGNHYPDPK